MREEGDRKREGESGGGGEEVGRRDLWILPRIGRERGGGGAREGEWEGENCGILPRIGRERGGGRERRERGREWEGENCEILPRIGRERERGRVFAAVIYFYKMRPASNYLQ